MPWMKWGLRWGFPLAVTMLLVVHAAVAQACTGWNTKAFFETATLARVESCLAGGADTAARDKIGYTPLHWAAGRNENPDVITTLIDHGADTAARTEDGYTPFGLIGDDSPLRGTEAYWRLNDARFK